MTSRAQRIFENAREILRVGNAIPVHYWFQHNVMLTTVNITMLNENGMMDLRNAICRCTRKSTIDVTDVDIINIHKKLTSKKNVDLFNLNDTKSMTNNDQLYTLYYYEKDGIRERMLYYEHESLVRGSCCFDLEHLTDGRILLSNCYFYGFLMRADNGPHAFIHNGGLYNIVFFNPNNPLLNHIELPQADTWANASYPDDETRAIFESIKKRYNASMYFANMETIQRNGIVEKNNIDNYTC